MVEVVDVSKIYPDGEEALYKKLLKNEFYISHMMNSSLIMHAEFYMEKPIENEKFISLPKKYLSKAYIFRGPLIKFYIMPISFLSLIKGIENLYCFDYKYRLAKSSYELIPTKFCNLDTSINQYWCWINRVLD